MRLITLSLLFFSCHYFLYTQENNNQIELRFDNDEFLLSDRYYTSGVFLSYKKSINKSKFSNKKTAKLQYELSIGNEIYTPQDVDYDNVDRFHRPYAGWLFGKVRVGSIKNKYSLFLGVETGVTGDESLAKTFQDWAHSRVGIRNATWIEQISYKWLVNIEAQLNYLITSRKQSSLVISTRPVLGTKDMLFDNELYYFFGELNKFKNSSRFSTINTSIKKELFGFISFGHRLVFHNTLIEGSIFEDDILFTSDIEKHIFKWKIGLVSKGKKGVFKFSYNFNSRETPLSKIHGFGSISYGVNF